MKLYGWSDLYQALRQDRLQFSRTGVLTPGYYLHQSGKSYHYATIYELDELIAEVLPNALAESDIMG